MSEGSLLRPGRECTRGLAFSLRALTLPRPLPSLPPSDAATVASAPRHTPVSFLRCLFPRALSSPSQGLCSHSLATLFTIALPTLTKTAVLFFLLILHISPTSAPTTQQALSKGLVITHRTGGQCQGESLDSWDLGRK